MPTAPASRSRSSLQARSRSARAGLAFVRRLRRGEAGSTELLRQGRAGRTVHDDEPPRHERTVVGHTRRDREEAAQFVAVGSGFAKPTGADGAARFQSMHE